MQYNEVHFISTSAFTAEINNCEPILALLTFFRDCIMELLGVVCTIMQTTKGLSKDFNTGTSQICLSKELEWLLLLRGKHYQWGS